MKWRVPLAVFAVGLLISFGGMFYYLFTVGMPTQDPTPAVAAYESRVEHLTKRWFEVGGVVALVGFLWLGVLVHFRIERRRAATRPRP